MRIIEVRNWEISSLSSDREHETARKVAEQRLRKW